MTEQELWKIEERLKTFNAGLNALGSDAFDHDRQRAKDIHDLIESVNKLRRVCGKLASERDDADLQVRDLTAQRDTLKEISTKVVTYLSGGYRQGMNGLVLDLAKGEAILKECISIGELAVEKQKCVCTCHQSSRKCGCCFEADRNFLEKHDEPRITACTGCDPVDGKHQPSCRLAKKPVQIPRKIVHCRSGSCQNSDQCPCQCAACVAIVNF